MTTTDMIVVLFAAAVTCLIYLGMSVSQLLYWILSAESWLRRTDAARSEGSSRPRRRRISRRRRRRFVRKEMEETLTVRLVLTGFIAVMGLLVSSLLFRAPPTARLPQTTGEQDPPEEPNDPAEEYYDTNDDALWWSAFLDVNGVLLALLVLATLHAIHWRLCGSGSTGVCACGMDAGPPCDDTVDASDSDSDDDWDEEDPSHEIVKDEQQHQQAQDCAKAVGAEEERPADGEVAEDPLARTSDI